MQVLLNGLISGAMIGALALAFSLAYLPSGVFHLALAGIYSLAPFIAWSALGMGFGWPLSLTFSVAACAVLSLLVEILNHRRLEERGASPSSHMISSLGIYIVVTQAAAAVWGNDPHTLRTSADSVTAFANVRLSFSQGVEFLSCGTVIVAVLVLLQATKTGLYLRALAENPALLMINGYPVWRLRGLSFALSGAIAAIVSLCAAFDYGFEPNGGLPTLLLAAVAVMIGGRGSFVAPIGGALLLGVIRAETDWLLSARWQDPITFLALAAVLLLRPFGLFASAPRLEAQ